jgi:hypothetical protein
MAGTAACRKSPVILAVGPEIETAIIDAVRTGAATQRTPSSISSSSMTYPWARMVVSSADIRSVSVNRECGNEWFTRCEPNEQISPQPIQGTSKDVLNDAGANGQSSIGNHPRRGPAIIHLTEPSFGQ